MDSRAQLLAGPLQTHQGVPLRVAAYQRIAERIRDGALTPGSMLPSEAELGSLFEVSRTVIREALMLLQEDGLVRSRNGIGRFVSDVLPRIGLEQLQPLETLIGARGAVALRRTEETLQEAAATWIADGLQVAVGSPVWFVETLLLIDAEPVALLQEHLPTGRRLAELGESFLDGAETPRAVPASVLGHLVGRFGARLGPATSEIAVGVPGPTRGALLECPEDEPLLLLTQTVHLDGHPAYLAKQLITPRAGHLDLVHGAPG